MTITMDCPVCGGELEVIVAGEREDGGVYPVAEEINLPCCGLTDDQTDAIWDAAFEEWYRRYEGGEV
jgi:hypothetical protein